MKDRSLAQTLTPLFGLAFLGAGILGFIPGITTNLGDIEFAGNDSPADGNFVPVNTAEATDRPATTTPTPPAA